MLALCILGFLDEGALHAYDLRRRISGLSGHVRPLSDGALYPAVRRLVDAGLVERDPPEPGTAGASRLPLRITAAGRAELDRRLREPEGVEITDRNAFTVLLAFLGRLRDPAAQAAVLRRRLAFLDEPASFFYDGERPVRAEEVDDPFRRGLLLTARATSRADRAWLRETIAALEGEP